MRIEAHPLERIIGAARRDELVERYLGRRSDAPLLKLRIGFDYFGAEETDGTEVLAYLRLDNRRIEALAGVIIDKQRAVGSKLRSEEARRRVGQHVIFAGRDVEAEDVGSPSIIRIAEQRFPVVSEGEHFGHRRRQRESRDGIVGVALFQV